MVHVVRGGWEKISACWVWFLESSISLTKLCTTLVLLLSPSLSHLIGKFQTLCA